MSKEALVRSFKEKVEDITLQKAKEYVDLFLDTITEELENGEEVKLPKIGKLYVVQKEERQGRNPKTGEAITIAAKNVVRFKASSTLKTAVNQ